jgi:hypothetical protein
LAESVSPNDYDWFTPADLTRVIDAIHALPDWKSVVLVGGQSLTAWVEYYKIKLPTLKGPYLTIDADFLGTKTEAELIAKELGSNAQIPSIDDHTPNAATIDFTGASGKRLRPADFCTMCISILTQCIPLACHIWYLPLQHQVASSES